MKNFKRVLFIRDKYIMTDSTQKDNTHSDRPEEQKTNESAGFYFSSSVKIVDPKTGDVLLHKRAD